MTISFIEKPTVTGTLGLTVGMALSLTCASNTDISGATKAYKWTNKATSAVLRYIKSEMKTQKLLNWLYPVVTIVAAENNCQKIVRHSVITVKVREQFFILVLQRTIKCFKLN